MTERLYTKDSLQTGKLVSTTTILACETLNKPELELHPHTLTPTLWLRRQQHQPFLELAQPQPTLQHSNGLIICAFDMTDRKTRQPKMESQANVTKSSAKKTKLQPSPQVVADTMSDEALALRIQALPQALQDNILEALENIMSDEALALRIQALPQELQDNILESLDEFQVTSNHVIITSTYKPPLPLQLSQKMRAKFARKYYGTANFGDDLKREREQGRLYVWVRSLTKEHREMVARVHRVFTLPFYYAPVAIVDLWQWLLAKLSKLGLINAELVLLCRIESQDVKLARDFRVVRGSDGPEITEL